MKEVLQHLADQILDLDFCELSEMLPEIQARMEACDLSREWERSVINFFLINGIRFKGHLADKACQEPEAEQTRQRHLRVVK